MRWSRLLGAAAIATAALAGTASAARYDDAPRGSYLNSCRNAYERGGVLYADCRIDSGRYVRASVSLRGCRGDIYNSGGRLYCRSDYAYRDRDRYDRSDRYDRDDRYRDRGYAPNGSYRNSCRSAYERRGVLYAECRTSSGRYVETSLSLRNCSGDIANHRGQLYCEDRYGYNR